MENNARAEGTIMGEQEIKQKQIYLGYHEKKNVSLIKEELICVICELPMYVSGSGIPYQNGELESNKVEVPKGCNPVGIECVMGIAKAIITAQESMKPKIKYD